MYNEERKLQYISEKTDGAVVSSNLGDAFVKSEQREIEYGRDICEWTSEEILDFYRYYGSRSIQTLVMLHNLLTSYASWCGINGLISDNQNHFLEIKTDALCKCVDVNAVNNIIMTRDELLETIHQFLNMSDRYVFLGLFEGIPLNAIGAVRLDDLNKNVLTLPDGSTRELSNELVNIMHLADEEESYMSMAEKRKGIFPYVDGCNTVLKPFVARKSVEKNAVLMVGNRIRRCIKYCHLSPGITIKSISKSGRIQFIKDKAKEFGIRTEVMASESQYRIMHEEIYGKVQNMKTFLLIYGDKLKDDVE